MHAGSSTVNMQHSRVQHIATCQLAFSPEAGDHNMPVGVFPEAGDSYFLLAGMVRGARRGLTNARVLQERMLHGGLQCTAVGAQL